MRGTSLGCLVLALAALSGPAAAQSQTDTFTLPPEPGRPPPERTPPVVAEPPATVAVGPSWEIDGGLSGALLSAHPTRGPDLSGRGATGTLGVARFLRPLADDDAPRSLLPFLQRVSEVYASFDGGAFVTDNPSGAPDSTSSALGVEIGVDAYLVRFFALKASAGYGLGIADGVNGNVTSNGFSITAGPGFRVGDARFDATYTFREVDVDGRLAPYRWGPIALSVYVVVARRSTIGAAASAFEDGGSGGVTVGHYVTREIGLFAGLLGGAGRPDNGLAYRRYGGDIGASIWVSAPLRLSAYYTLIVVHVPEQTAGGLSYGSDQVSHVLRLAAAVRL